MQKDQILKQDFFSQNDKLIFMLPPEKYLFPMLTSSFA